MGLVSSLVELVSGRSSDAEERALTVPWNIGPGRYNAGGGMSQGRALTLAPVFASVRHITDLASTLPLKAYRDLGAERSPMASLPKLFADLEADGELVRWLCQAVASLVIHGNAIGIITARDGFMFPTQVVWLAKSRVSVDERSGVPVWYVDGRAVPRSDIAHIPWITMPGSVMGLSPIEYYASTIGAGIDSWRYGADWFASGGIPPGKFKNTQKTITPDAARTIRQRLVESIRGHEPLVYGSDWDYEPIAIPPEQAQFIETNKMTANQIAAMYGLNPVEVGGEPPNGLTYSNEARRAMQRLSNLQPYLTRFERVFKSWLPELQYVKFNGDAIVRADIETRWGVYKTARELGAMNVDEIRALEDQAPLPDGLGQDYTPQKGMTPQLPGPTALPKPSEPNPARSGGDLDTPQGRVIDLLGRAHV